MENKEKLAEHYAHNYFEMHETNNYKALKQGFLAGFEAGTPKWINIEDKLPEDDRTVVCWAENVENTLYSELKLGSYIDGMWYCKGGRNSQEIITKWQRIAE